MNDEPFALSLVEGFPCSDTGFDGLSPNGKLNTSPGQTSKSMKTT